MPAVPMSDLGIADDITARIRSGEYQPGAKLPSYRELADLYSVSVSTAYRAVTRLKERGLATGRPGRGVFVADRTEG